MSSDDIKNIGRDLRQITDPVTRRLFERILSNTDTIKAAISTLESPDPLTWADLVLENSWVEFSSSYFLPQFTKTNNGFVVLRGRIKSGTTTGGTVMFNLPAGFRPELIVTIDTVSNNAIATFHIEPNGDATIQTGSNASFALDNIQFPAFR